MVMPAVDAPTAVGAAGRLCGEDLSRCGAPAALEGAVDRRAADPEQVGDLGCAVLPGGDQADQMSVLPCVELGPAAAQAALGLRDPHPWPPRQSPDTPRPRANRLSADRSATVTPKARR